MPERNDIKKQLVYLDNLSELFCILLNILEDIGNFLVGLNILCLMNICVDLKRTHLRLNKVNNSNNNNGSTGSVHILQCLYNHRLEKCVRDDFERKNVLISQMTVLIYRISQSVLTTFIYNAMGADVSIQDIDIAHRIPVRNKKSQGKPKPIICKFIRRVWRSGNITSSQLGVGSASADTSCNIRMFDYLTPKQQFLLYEAKNFKTIHHFEYCWAKNNKVYLRETNMLRILLE